MKAFILVGCTRSGKSHLCKQIIRDVNPKALFVHDVQGEYAKLPWFAGTAFKGNIDMFLGKIYDENSDEHLITNGVFVFEEATNFFSTRGNDRVMRSLLVGKYHSNNTYLMMFHSMRDVPKYLARLCTDIFIFKTLDEPQYIDKNFNYLGLSEAWHQVNDNISIHPFFGKGHPWDNKKAPCPAPYKRIKVY